MKTTAQSDRLIRRLKLWQLRLIVAVAEHASILRAAQELNISQPAATKLVQDLESEFEVKLFDRNNRGVTPTEFGVVLIKHGSLILAQLSTANQELEDLREGTGGRIVVGTLISASAQLLPEAVAELKKKRPNLEILIRTGVNDILIPELQAGLLDMVVGRLPEYRYREQLVQEPLHEDDMCIVAGAHHPLAIAKNISLQDMVSSRWILPPPATTLRRQIDKLFLDRDCETPAQNIESVSYLIIRKLLTISDHICILPNSVVKIDLHNGLLTRLDVAVEELRSVMGVSYRRNEGLSPAAGALLKQLHLTSKTIQAENSHTLS